MDSSAFGEGSWIFGLIVLLGLFGGFNGGGFGGNNAAMTGMATIADVNAANAAQTSQLNQQSILLSSANNNFEMSRQLADQNMFMANQNNANATNILQGFNALQMQIANQTSTISSKLDALGFNMEQCCCSIKTMIKDNQIADLQNQLNNANNIAVNSAQSQYLLGQMGKWVANASATA
jgi:hypothetical protein